MAKELALDFSHDDQLFSDEMEEGLDFLYDDQLFSDETELDLDLCYDEDPLFSDEMEQGLDFLYEDQLFNDETELDLDLCDDEDELFSGELGQGLDFSYDDQLFSDETELDLDLCYDEDQLFSGELEQGEDQLFSDEMEQGDQTNTMSDVNYVQGLQFLEVRMASLVTSQIRGNAASSVTQGGPSEPDDAGHVMKEVGQSSLSFCEICAERKENDQMFTVERCKHFFCNDCVSKHVKAKAMDSVHVVKCPAVDCKVVLEFDSCTSLMSKDALDKWNEVLCRSLIPDSQKFYCPYKNCSATLLRDTEEVIMESVCPECRRLFCARCRVPWHSEVGCEEFQKLNEDERGREDILLMELAKEKKWNRCPRCKFYVEKTEGCLHMTCRCGFQFCYACGATWSTTHGGCQ